MEVLRRWSRRGQLFADFALARAAFILREPDVLIDQSGEPPRQCKYPSHSRPIMRHGIVRLPGGRPRQQRRFGGH
jgi:hypothetical protein